jgi:hypothetical protein
MNSTSLIPGAIIFHTGVKEIKYTVLSVKKDIEWYNITVYTITHKHYIQKLCISNLLYWECTV